MVRLARWTLDVAAWLAVGLLLIGAAGVLVTMWVVARLTGVTR